MKEKQPETLDKYFENDRLVVYVDGERIIAEWKTDELIGAMEDIEAMHHLERYAVCHFGRDNFNINYYASLRQWVATQGHNCV